MTDDEKLKLISCEMWFCVYFYLDGFCCIQILCSQVNPFKYQINTCLLLFKLTLVCLRTFDVIHLDCKQILHLSINREWKSWTRWSTKEDSQRIFDISFLEQHDFCYHSWAREPRKQAYWQVLYPLLGCVVSFL